MSNRTRRKIEQKAKDTPLPAQKILVAQIRKSRNGHTAVIDSINPDGSVREMFGTCSAAEMTEAIGKAYDLMLAEAGSARMVRLVVEGEPAA